MKKKLLFALLLLLCCTVVFSGGQKEAGKEKKVALRMWLHDPAVIRWFEKQAEVYNEKHPEMEFSLDILQTDAGEIATKFLTAAATGDPKLMPDFFGLQHFWFPRIMKAQLEDEILDLRPYIEKDLPDLANYEMWMYSDKIYGLNWSLSACVYYYNKELLDKAGVDPMGFVTYDDFIAAGKKSRKATGAYMTPIDVAAWNQYQIFFLQNDGGIFDKQGKVVLDDPKNIEALEMWKRLLDEDVAWPVTEFYSAGPFEAYRNEVLAGCIMADWYGDYVMKPKIPEMKGKWRLAPLPAFRKGGRRTAKRGGTGVYIVKKSPYKDMALDFFKFCYFDVDSLVRKFQMISYFPNYKPAMKDPRLLEFKDEFYGGQKIGKLYLDLFDEIPPYYHSPYMLESFDILNTEVIPKVYKGELTPEAALKNAAKKLRQVAGQ
jgi:ABC-type glycerol-3-phosphate transport system substrate-binding protein